MGEYPSQGLFPIVIGNGPFGQVIPVQVNNEVATYNQPINPAGTTNAVQPVAKSVTGITASGNTTIWTPTAGTRFVLASYQIYVSLSAAKTAPANSIFTITDGNGGTVLGSWHLSFPGTSVTTGIGTATSGQVTLPDGGIRSGAINTNLVFNMGGGALTNGVISVNTYGWEV